MRSLTETIRANEAQVLKEWEEYLNTGNTEKVVAIILANPDLFGPAVIRWANVYRGQA